MDSGHASLGRALIVAAALCLSSAATSEIAADFEDRIRLAMDEVVAAGAPGVIVLVRDGHETVRLATGFGNLAPKVPIDVMDRFRIGSLIKSYVAVVVLQLVEEGKLRLDQVVEDVLPGSVPHGANITVRQLLNHTSGIFDYWQDEWFFKQLLADPARPWRPERLVQLAIAHPPLSSPGAKWSYANTNYILLGQMIEVATGQSLRTELDTRIFRPLRLDGTSFVDSAEIVGAHAHGYAILGEPEPVDVTKVNPTSAWAAGGGGISTADDIATFMGALMSGRLLTAEFLHEMLTTVSAGEDLGYGLGIANVRLPCGSAWGHQGEFPGYLAFALSSRDGSRQTVVLINFYSLGDSGKAAFRQLVASAFCG